ncbi:MAG: universal stress protein [Rubritepida sp.]|jgi:nucleotide-binding universal stress UspA family protein|nr:universal stress protein [Rubritepida sp.]
MPEAAERARRDRVFLVVVDDSPERAVALRYAALRVAKSGGRVALLRVVEPVEQAEWAGIGAMMAQERLEEAESMLAGLAAQVKEITGGLPMLITREGKTAEQLLALLAEDPRISILVLAAAADSKGPGPLIQALTGRLASKMTVPMTVVPGTMSDAELDRVT